MIEIGTLLQKRYLIEKQIGAGGMGAVYLAVDKRFDNHVAIKETFYRDQELAEAFEREARLLNALQHPALPHVSDYFTENNVYFLVMQFIEGEDLSDILKRDGAFSIETVMRWTDNLLDALDYLHSQEPPIIHRDIKPHNLKLTPRGDIILLDFGLAKLNSDDTNSDKSVFGYSRTYSPLEQIQGTGTDARSDIFALGATVYHLLTGRPPIDALTRAASIVNGKTDPLKLANEIRPDISTALASVLNSALALNPDHRFASAQAMRLALGYVGAETTADESAVNDKAAAMIPPAQVFDTDEKAEFPALEAFAAEESAPLVVDIKSDAAQTRNGKLSADSPYSTKIVASAPAVPEKNGKNKKSLLWAAAAALLFVVLASGWFLSKRPETAPPSDPTTISESSPAPESRTKPAVKDETAAETKSKTETKEKKVETVSLTKTEPVKEPAEVTEDAPEPRIEKPQISPRRPNAPAVNESQTRNDRVLDAAEVESIFTGKKEESRRNGEQRRRTVDETPDEMSEQEFEQMRRERRERRRERRRQQKLDPIPF